MKGGCYIMKNNIVYVDFTQKKILSTSKTSFRNSIKKFIKKLFTFRELKTEKVKPNGKRIHPERYFS